jgi:carbonic anhydrase/acetyltransferase-like protein (isoleucine patch superfamily)
VRGRAVILRTDTVISPFGDHVSEAFFTHQTLAETQAQTCGIIQFEIVRADDTEAATKAIRESKLPVLVMLDRIYLSEKAAKDFLGATKTIARPCRLALSKNASVEYTLPLQDILQDGGLVIHDVVLVDPQGPLPQPSSDPVGWIRAIGGTPVDVPKRELVAEIQLPTIGERDKTKMRYPITSTVVVSIEHWVHILWLNQIAFGIRWMEILRRHPVWGVLRAISAFSLDRNKLLDRLVRRGSGCEIHPTARLSASIVGSGVKIGPHATVRNSIVGDGAIVQDHAVLLNTVIGPRTLVTENTFLVSTVAYPDATVGNYKLQVTLIGRGAYVNAWAGFVDAKFVGDVKVLHKGELVGSGRSFLGSVVGHRAKVAAKVLIQAGREIPNDTMVVMRPDEVVSVVPDRIEEGVPMVRDRGTLVPLGKESKGAPA